MTNKIQHLFSIFFPIIGGIIIGFVIKNQIDYNQLTLPFLAPKSFIFPIVWSILYLFIGISYYLYRKENNDLFVKILYYGQLFFNFSWALLFFLVKWRFFSIIWIIILIFLVGYLMYFYYYLEKKSFYLFIPYILWLFFALYLNVGVWLLN